MAAMLLTGAATAQAQNFPNAGLADAATRYPPFTTGENVRPTQGVTPTSCPATGEIEREGGVVIAYHGAHGANPGLCRMTANGVPYQAWNAIWHAEWPGAADAAVAMTRVLQGPTGTVVGFDVRAAPGAAWHDLLRNEGVEDINLLGRTYHAVKMSHYREGFDGNIYRSVTTVWKDIPTGALLFTTYDHIAGRPALEQAFIPVRISLTGG